MALLLEHFAQPKRARILAERWRGNEQLSRERALDQPCDLLRGSKTGVSGLPRFDAFAAR